MRGIRNWSEPVYKYFGPEDRMATAVADYVRLQYPRALWWHTPNEGKRGFAMQKKAEALGILSGVSDLIFPSPKPGFKGLVLELKIKPNKLSPAQKIFLEKMQTHGWIAEVAYDFEQAMNIIDKFMKTNYVI